MDELTVGLIGCGRIAQFFHARNLASLPGARFVAYADPDVERRAETAGKAPEAVAYTHHTDLLAHPGLDAVVISLPTGMHAAVAAEAFRAGKHVYLEKPLATGLEEAHALLGAWRESGRVGMIGFNNRFHPLYQEARRRLLSGEIGRPIGARGVVCSPARELPPWKRRRASGGGALLDLATHHTDLAAFFFGLPVRRVSASVWSIHTEADNAALTMELEGGLTVQLFVSLTSVQENRFELYGDRGKLEAEHHSGTLAVSPPERGHTLAARARQALGVLAAVPRDLVRTARPPTAPSYRLALQSFAEAALRGHPPDPDLMDGYRSLLVLLAAEESARTGRVVDVAPLGLAAERPAG